MPSPPPSPPPPAPPPPLFALSTLLRRSMVRRCCQPALPPHTWPVIDHRRQQHMQYTYTLTFSRPITTHTHTRIMGSSIYDILKKIGVFPPLPVRMRPHEPEPSSPCGRPHATDMKYTSLS